MKQVKVSHPHSQSREDVRELLGGLTGELESKLQLKTRWSNEDTIEFARKGIDGRLLITDTDVQITIKLGLLASAFAPQIKSELERQMANRLS